MTVPIQAMALAAMQQQGTTRADYTDEEWQEGIAMMTAAYNALRDTLVPAGWLYADGDTRRVSPLRLSPDERDPYDIETPLYALPEIKP